ncbi:hypothetical protein W02_42940 [Nitrospira sp. KM1]|uniref:YbhB/YbcL family Raf kinase inhibitor-like protein n=1 Tax=Nitrospira sp. KM1 TaxID=1936990 RepID=UPI0013A72554|nr:YbhB/YbcL family Raf kinase inhibitor-like protein [Nitrospira sp. KM1]BCA57154.1 hypothetical protein W02_42940 [Nitrospira sp. KM1]
MALTLTSPAFESGSSIPKRFTSAGENLSPPLEWSGVTPETKELALICLDPDAPTPRTFVHWIAYGISPDQRVLEEGIPQAGRISGASLYNPIRQGRNSLFSLGYTGPNVPPRHGKHSYIFELYALDRLSHLPPGSGRAAFYRAIHGHVIDQAQLVGFSDARAGRTPMTWTASLIKNSPLIQDGGLKPALATGVIGAGMLALVVYTIRNSKSRQSSWINLAQRIPHLRAR